MKIFDKHKQAWKEGFSKGRAQTFSMPKLYYPKWQKIGRIGIIFIIMVGFWNDHLWIYFYWFTFILIIIMYFLLGYRQWICQKLGMMK